MSKQRIPIQLVIVVAGFGLALLIYSQVVAYWGDESLHLVAGQLMNAGKRPYLDFFYNHTPLFVYLVWGLMRVFGESWRVVHAASAVLTTGCLLLTAMYVYTRVRDGELQLYSSIVAAVLVGLNCYVICFGTVALPYGFCLFFSVAAFFLIVESVDHSGSRLAFGAGACAAAASSAYLLTVPVIPLLFVWMLLNNRQGSRVSKSIWYVAGSVLSFVPLLWLALHSPHQVWADLVLYHLFHRAGRDLDLWFNVREIAGWFVSIQGVILVGLAAIGLSSIKWRDKFDPRLGSELRLLVWLVLALCFVVAIARPTSSFYFVLISPFVAMLAAFGLCAICYRVGASRRLVCIIVIVMSYAIGLSAQRYIWRWQTSYTDHRVVAKIARTVEEVTPETGMIYAFEAVYFEAHRLPPPGLENRFNPASKADEWLQTGQFDTVCIGVTNPRVKAFKLLERYAKRQTFTENGQALYILWEKSTFPPSAEEPKK